MTGPAAPPGWYPDPTGGGQKYWDGALWHDAVPTRPGIQTAAKAGMSRNAKVGWTVAACLVAVIAVGNVLTTSDDKKPEPAAARSTATQPVMSKDELADAEFSSLLIQRGVDFDAADRDDLILRAHTVCVFLNVNDGSSLTDAGRGLMDSYGYSTDEAAAIAYSAVQVYCPERR